MGKNIRKLKIGLCQLKPVKNNQVESLKIAEEYISQASKSAVDLVVFPEMWSVGYNLPEIGTEDRINEFTKQALTIDGDYIQTVKKLAQKYRLAICITYLRDNFGKMENALVLIDRMGQHVLEYSKVHTCDFGSEKILHSGQSFNVGVLDVGFTKLKVGAMICYDREFTESARTLMLKGAELILVPNACELEQNRIAQLISRAFENMLAIVCVNYVNEQEKWCSYVFDGMAFDKAGNSRDMQLLKTDLDQALYICELDLEALRIYRLEETWGNAYRKPNAYQLIVEHGKEVPFVRWD
ncbi:MAG: carbon-nitrogen hydrolase family protein [Mycoplasmatales bacterium]